MSKFNLKSKLGFTLIELLVVIGILAVLAAIAIPSVAGLIDRANVSSDATNANEMTNAIERFTSEYELYLQDIASGRLDASNLDSAQGRVYNVTEVTDRTGIENLEKDATAGPDTTGKAIYRDTKYPVNAETMQAVVENYMKTTSSTFTPKQSDMHFWYSPEIGVVVVAKPNADIVADLNSQVQSGQNAKGEQLDNTTIWIDITINNNEGSLPKPPISELTTLTPMTWNGNGAVYGDDIWTDGTNYYYSRGYAQYVLNGDTWEAKTWNNNIRIQGSCVWTDGVNIYHTWGGTYVLNGGTWVSKSWNGLNDITGDYLWTDGTNYYYSYNFDQYVLNGDTWVSKTWNGGVPRPNGETVWTDGTNTYCGGDYFLNGDTWVLKTWDFRISYFEGKDVWSDGTNIYYSEGTRQYVLKGNTWVEKTWDGLASFDGRYVWTDGTHYYYSNGATQYIFS